jgi:hypothetical protein
MVVGGFACTPLCRRLIEKVFSVKGGWVLETAAVVLILALCVASLVSSSYNPFLYFRF